MSPYEIISHKRDGRELSDAQISWFIRNFVSGTIADYQMTALLMAIFLNGMTAEEGVSLTRAYIASGVVADLSAIPGIKVDKHSTGGVGDKVSIVLAPLVASLGVPVPMISGRGLGHSGGTLDKLESIPGFRTDLSLERFQELVKKHRLALAGQTADFVPADKRIYALRDVTATVSSIPLITASIMSKKIAEGIDALVLDVKYGNGAFIQDAGQAEILARTMVDVGKLFGKKVVVLITSMDQPLGRKIGNWLEIEECVACLNGGGPDDLVDLTVRLSAHMLLLGGAATSLGDAERLCREALSDGRAYQKFLEIVDAQGGNLQIFESTANYPQAALHVELLAVEAGYVYSMDTYQIGMAAVELGAGRKTAADTVDPAAGIILYTKTGDFVVDGQPILQIHTNRAASIDPALERLRNAIRISAAVPAPPPLILKEIVE